MTSLTLMEGILKTLSNAYGQLLFHILFNHYNSFAVVNFATDDVFCKNSTQMHVNRCLDLFVTYRDDSNKNNGNKNQIAVEDEPSSSQISMSSILVFDSEKNKHHLLRLIDSNGFGTKNCDAHMNTKIDFFINRISGKMTIQELETLYRICHLKNAFPNHIRNLSSKSLIGWLPLIGNRSNFLCVEGSTASDMFVFNFFASV